MRLDTERERGNIGDDTEIVNDGEYMGYAEATLGGWTVEFERARSGDTLHAEPERVTFKGPFMDDDMHGGEHRDMEATVGVWQKVTEAIDTWDYVEAAEEEVFST
jgi:hypothetical protein